MDFDSSSCNFFPGVSTHVPYVRCCQSCPCPPSAHNVALAELANAPFVPMSNIRTGIQHSYQFLCWVFMKALVGCLRRFQQCGQRMMSNTCTLLPQMNPELRTASGGSIEQNLLHSLD